MTQAERMARMETLLEEKVVAQIEEMRADIKAIRSDLDDDKSELATLKAKGAGVLLGVSIAAAGLGASIATGFKWVVDLFN